MCLPLARTNLRANDDPGLTPVTLVVEYGRHRGKSSDEATFCDDKLYGHAQAAAVDGPRPIGTGWLRLTAAYPGSLFAASLKLAVLSYSTKYTGICLLDALK